MAVVVLEVVVMVTVVDVVLRKGGRAWCGNFGCVMYRKTVEEDSIMSAGSDSIVDITRVGRQSVDVDELENTTTDKM